MKHRNSIGALAVVLSTLSLGAQAQVGMTREQARNELAEALRSGDILSGESGLTLREQFPNRYPPVAKPPGLTRAQVRAELADAIRNGQLVAGGEIGARPDQGIAGAFPRELMVGQRTRADVQQELAEAIRTGDILAGGESGQLLNQRDPAHYTRMAARKPKPGASMASAGLIQPPPPPRGAAGG